MSFLDIATPLADKGFYVFPLAPNSKLPAIKDYSNLASRLQSHLEKWNSENPNYNVGISTDDLLAVDVDNKNGKKGDDELFRLELEGFELPETYEQITPTGGRHLVYRVTEPVKQGTNVLGRGLDTRARGGYIVGAGSRIQGRAYTAIDRDIQCAPDWLVSRCGRSVEREPSEVKVIEGVDRIRAATRAVHFLRNEAHPSIEGAGGDENAFRVACQVKDMGIDEATCLELMLGHWNERCSPPWAAGDLHQKVHNAYRYGTEPQGVNAPEAQFSPVVVEAKAEVVLSPEEKFLKKYAYVARNHGVVIEESFDHEGNPVLVQMDVRKFHVNTSNQKISFGDKSIPISRLWITHPKRKTYEALTFAPGINTEPRFYNLWKGFCFEPYAKMSDAKPNEKRALDDFIEHALKNVCDGDHGLFRWMMGWFAHVIQKPNEKPQTALVFKGSKGTGKNALVERVAELLGFGKHALVVSNPRYLTGNFNRHLENKLMIVLDEAFWSGDKSADGVLKNLITGKDHVIEPKGMDPYSVRNLTRVVIIGNEEWLVPASNDERRYAVFNVGEGRKQDTEFFKSMRLDMESGGYRLLMRYLLDYDLTGVNVDVAPNTKGLLDQKLNTSIWGPKGFWRECLRRGRIVGLEFGNTWPPFVEKEAFRNAYRSQQKSEGNRYCNEPDQVIGRALKEMCPSMDSKQKKTNGSEDRPYCYIIPPLEICRKEYERFIGGDETLWE